MKHAGPAKTKPRADTAPADHEQNLGLERLIFFSDAVFAIAITLLALDIRLPATEASLTNEQLRDQLLGLAPQYFSYLLSFLVIGIFWIGHHRKFQLIKRYDTNLIFLNLLLLMLIAFIPFPTAVISEYGNRTATIFYALTMTATSLMALLLWLYATYKGRLVDPELARQHRLRTFWSPLVTLAIFALSIGIAFIDDDLAKFSWILIAPATLLLR